MNENRTWPNGEVPYEFYQADDFGELIATKFAPIPKTAIVKTFFSLDEQAISDIYRAMDEYAENC